MGPGKDLLRIIGFILIYLFVTAKRFVIREKVYSLYEFWKLSDKKDNGSIWTDKGVQMFAGFGVIMIFVLIVARR
jgi:hypothetical protein